MMELFFFTVSFSSISITDYLRRAKGVGLKSLVLGSVPSGSI